MVTAQLLTASAAILAGSIVQGIAGFGMALVSVPFLLHFLPQNVVTPASIICGTFMNAFFMWNLRHSISWKLIMPVLAGAAAGVYPGVKLLEYVPAGPFRIGVGIVIVISAILLWLGVKCPVHSRPLQLAVGFIAGVMSGALSVSGPPVAFFFTAGDVKKDVFRSSLSMFFLALNLFTIAALAADGILTALLLRFGLELVPAVLAGSFIGLKLAGHVSEKLFRSFVMIMIILSGLSLLF
jgi:uncharacterized membrane protein YfcA